jgi:hypothetical protein
MEITLTTPALLFPAISLLFLSYTNRFLAIATLIRNLHSKYKTDQSQELTKQIKNLKLRVTLIRNMQVLGVLSLLLCVVCMFLLFEGFIIAGQWVFAISLILLICSLTLSTIEIMISTKALNIQLGDMEKI